MQSKGDINKFNNCSVLRLIQHLLSQFQLINAPSYDVEQHDPITESECSKAFNQDEAQSERDIYISSILKLFEYLKNKDIKEYDNDQNLLKRNGIMDKCVEGIFGFDYEKGLKNKNLMAFEKELFTLDSDQSLKDKWNQLTTIYEYKIVSFIHLPHGFYYKQISNNNFRKRNLMNEMEGTLWYITDQDINCNYGESNDQEEEESN